MSYESRLGPRKRAILLIVSTLLLAVSVTLIALSARPLEVWEQPDKYRRTVNLFFLDYNPYVDANWGNTFGYLSHDVDTTDVQTCIAAGALCLILGLAGVVMTIWDKVLGTYEFTISGRKTHKLPTTGPTTVFIIDICMGVISFIAFCITWGEWTAADWQLRRGLMPRYAVNYTLFYDSGYKQTLESWNCVLGRNMDSGPQPDFSPREIRSLCHQGRAARWLVLVLFILVLVRIAFTAASNFLSWRTGNIAERRQRQDMIHMERLKDLDLESQHSSTKRRREIGPSSVAELPADRTSKVEAADMALRELPGGDACVKEMDAGVVAVEADPQSSAKV